MSPEKLSGDEVTVRSDIYALAVKENDFASMQMLDWFIKEQVEEEGTMDKALHMVKMAAKAPHALMMLDAQFGKRE